MRKKGCKVYNIVSATLNQKNLDPLPEPHRVEECWWANLSRFLN